MKVLFATFLYVTFFALSATNALSPGLMQLLDVYNAYRRYFPNTPPLPPPSSSYFDQYPLRTYPRPLEYNSYYRDMTNVSDNNASNVESINNNKRPVTKITVDYGNSESQPVDPHNDGHNEPVASYSNAGYNKPVPVISQYYGYNKPQPYSPNSIYFKPVVHHNQGSNKPAYSSNSVYNKPGFSYNNVYNKPGFSHNNGYNKPGAHNNGYYQPGSHNSHNQLHYPTESIDYNQPITNNYGNPKPTPMQQWLYCNGHLFVPVVTSPYPSPFLQTYFEDGYQHQLHQPSQQTPDDYLAQYLQHDKRGVGYSNGAYLPPYGYSNSNDGVNYSGGGNNYGAKDGDDEGVNKDSNNSNRYNDDNDEDGGEDDDVSEGALTDAEILEVLSGGFLDPTQERTSSPVSAGSTVLNSDQDLAPSLRYLEFKPRPPHKTWGNKHHHSWFGHKHHKFPFNKWFSRPASRPVGDPHKYLEPNKPFYPSEHVHVPSRYQRPILSDPPSFQQQQQQQKPEQPLSWQQFLQLQQQPQQQPQQPGTPLDDYYLFRPFIRRRERPLVSTNN